MAQDEETNDDDDGYATLTQTDVRDADGQRTLDTHQHATHSPSLLLYLLTPGSRSTTQVFILIFGLSFLFLPRLFDVRLRLPPPCDPDESC